MSSKPLSELFTMLYEEMTIINGKCEDLRQLVEGLQSRCNDIEDTMSELESRLEQIEGR